MYIFAESMQEELVLFPRDLFHIEENHLGWKHPKSYFIQDPVYTIARAATSKHAEFVMKRDRKILGLFHFKHYIGYDPRARRWCDKLLVVIVHTKYWKRIITAYPVWRYQSLTSK